MFIFFYPFLALEINVPCRARTSAGLLLLLHKPFASIVRSASACLLVSQPRCTATPPSGSMSIRVRVLLPPMIFNPVNLSMADHPRPD
jgi:hypothetical protein